VGNFPLPPQSSSSATSIIVGYDFEDSVGVPDPRVRVSVFRHTPFRSRGVVNVLDGI